MRSDLFQFRATGPLGAAIEGHARALADVSTGIAARHLAEAALLIASSDMPTLTEAEASLVCDACNGAGLIPDTWQGVPMDVADAIRLNTLDTKWDVGGDSLVSRVMGWTLGQRWAVWCAVTRFWVGQPRDGDTVDQLREAGFRLVDVHPDQN